MRFFGVSQGVEYGLLCGGCGWSRIFFLNVKIKKKKKKKGNKKYHGIRD